MAKLPVLNRVVRILGKGIPQRNVDLVATDELGNGMLVANGSRAMPSDAVANVVDAWLARNDRHTVAAIGHGIRLVADPVSGNGSPCFIERRGVASGTLYLFGGEGKRAALLVAFEAAGIPLVSADVEGGSKTGLRVSLPPDCDGEVALSVIMGEHEASKGLSCYVATGCTGWDAGDMAQRMMVANNAEPLPIATKPESAKPKVDGAKGKRGRPAKAKADKQEDAPATTEGEQSAG